MKLFDFLIVPVRRSGGTAIQRFLSLHPNIIAIPKGVLDSALENGQEEQLLENLQESMRANPDLKYGLVQHKFVSPAHGLEDISRRLSRIVRKDGLILIFRNYSDALVSETNHGNIVTYCNYSFEKAGVNWPASIEMPQNLNAMLREYIDNSPEPNPPSGIPLNSPEQMADYANDSRFRYSEIQAIYERHFERPLSVDYDVIFDQSRDNSMRDIFQFIGADEYVDMPFFNTQQSGRSHRFLFYNQFDISSNYFRNWPVRMISRSIKDFSIEKGGTELALIFDDYIRDYLGFSAGLSLVTSSEVDLVTALRKRPMMIRLDAGRLMSEFIYPLWKHYYGAVSKVMDQFILRTIPMDSVDDVETVLESEKARFFAKNEDIGLAWKKRQQSRLP